MKSIATARFTSELTLKIERFQVLPVRFPLQNKFQTHLGAKTATHNVMIVIHGSDGMEGYGEASSSLAMPEATLKSMFEFLSRILPALVGQTVDDWDSILKNMERQYPNHPTALSALGCALLDLLCKSRRISLSQFFGGKYKKIETYYTIPLLPIEKCRFILNQAAIKGFKKFKIKVSGKDLESELKRVKMAWNYSQGNPLIIDANQGWNLEFAMQFIKRLAREKIKCAFIEQPFQKEDIQSFKQFKKHSAIPAAADESVRNLEDAKRFAEENAADIFNIKLAKCGFRQAIKIAEHLRKMKKKLMIGCMMESALGLAASVHWASGSGWFDTIDLDSFLLLKPLPIQAGFKSEAAKLWTDPKSLGSGTQFTLKDLEPWAVRA